MSDPDYRINEHENVHSMAQAELVNRLDVEQQSGLPTDEVRQRQQLSGKNELQEEKTKSPLLILASQFKSIVIMIMVTAAALALFTARWPEAIALVAVIIINTAIGFFTEYKAIRSMEALRQLGEYNTRARRDHAVVEVAAAELVPGDIVLLTEGDLVPADMRILEPGSCRVNEAALTGESTPVVKSAKPVEPKANLHARYSMLFKGTSITEGEVEGVVTATGLHTEIGRISMLTSSAEQQATPLQKRLDQLGRRLAWITLGIALLVGIAGIIAGRETVLMIEIAIALGIASIPEGLPIVATIALARGMWLMAKRNALVNRLTAVEALGATSVIFSDKTGTLTENRMKVTSVLLPEDEIVELKEQQHLQGEDPNENKSFMRVMRLGALCSNVKAGKENTDDYSGDPTEIALVEAASEYGLKRHDLLLQMEEKKEIPFDSESMMMATVHKNAERTGNNDGYLVAVKGAPSHVLEAATDIYANGQPQELTDTIRDQWLKKVEKIAASGLRVLALAEKIVNNPEVAPYENLIFAGVAALSDPPRKDVRQAIEQCQDAGIRVIMVTGDRPDTGAAIGRQVGLPTHDGAFHGQDLGKEGDMASDDLEDVLTANIFARVTPEQKYNLVKTYQNEGAIVAMTGDGVNDAPALKQADIGIAMGLRGTDAAKQVADMVLRDDRFSTIVAAVEQGRVIFANIRKSVMFMLCTNIAEVFVVATASLMQLPIPLRPLQILYLNVLTDVFPALALGLGASAVDVMKRPPRNADEPVLTLRHWKFIGLWSFIVGISVLGALTIALIFLGFDEKRSVTISFMTLAFAKLWFVFNLRDQGTQLWSNDIITNRWIWSAWLICLILLAAALYVPQLAMLLETVPPGRTGWLTIAVLSLVPVGLGTVLPGISFYTRVDD